VLLASIYIPMPLTHLAKKNRDEKMRGPERDLRRWGKI
jgi:hypothetical protein